MLLEGELTSYFGAREKHMLWMMLPLIGGVAWIMLLDVRDRLIKTRHGFLEILFLPFTRLAIPLWALVACALTLCSLGETHLPFGAFGDRQSAHVMMTPFTTFFMKVITVITMVTIVLSPAYRARLNMRDGEWYSLLLLCLMGCLVTLSASNLITLFLGIEFMGLPLYAMTALRGRSTLGFESSLKYSLLGEAASAFMLFGTALIWLGCGSLHISTVGHAILFGSHGSLFSIGAFVFLGAMLFKIGIAPFHMWVPDVYQGAPTPLSAFMATGIKIVSFMVLVRWLWPMPFEGDMLRFATIDLLADLLPWLAGITMTWGNVMALRQRDVKRMLAWSSVAHTGYILMALLPGTGHEGLMSLALYLCVYAIMNLGAFAVVALFSGDEDDPVHNLSGLFHSKMEGPWVAICMSVFLLSLSGIPLTAGFIAKFALFGAALKAGHICLVVIAIANSLLSLGYYIRLMLSMYTEKAPSSVKYYPSLGHHVVIALATVTVVWYGVYPHTLFNLLQSVLP